MLCNRQTAGPFTLSQRCSVAHSFIPNDVSLVMGGDLAYDRGIFSKSGEYIITAGINASPFIRIIRIKNNNSFVVTRNITAPQEVYGINEITLSPDGKTFAFCGYSPNLKVCSIADVHSSIQVLSASFVEKVAYLCCSFSYSTDIIGGATNGNIYTYCLERGRAYSRIRAHITDVNAITFAQGTSSVLYTGGNEGVIKVWDKRLMYEANPQPVGVLIGHLRGVTFIDTHSNGHNLITNARDGCIKLWDVRQLAPSLYMNIIQRNLLQNIDKKRREIYMMSGPRTEIDHGRRITGETSIMNYVGHKMEFSRIRCRFSPAATTGQRFIYSGSGDGRFLVYDSLTGKITRDVQYHTSCVPDVCGHPFKNELITSGRDGKTFLWTYRYLGE